MSIFLQKHSEGAKLELFIPCALDTTTIEGGPPRFADSGVWDWRRNPGRSANTYHSQFSQHLGYNSMKDIQEAVALGAILNTDAFGFKDRDEQVAKADFMLAFSWGKNEPEEGGTRHTWRLCKGVRRHIALASLPTSDMAE